MTRPATVGQAVKVTRARMIIEMEDGVPRIPQEVWAAVDARLGALPQPDSRHERDRWRITSRAAVFAAVTALAGQDSGEIPPELAERTVDFIHGLGGFAVVDHPLAALYPYLARIAGRQP